MVSQVGPNRQSRMMEGHCMVLLAVRCEHHRYRSQENAALAIEPDGLIFYTVEPLRHQSHVGA